MSAERRWSPAAGGILAAGGAGVGRLARPRKVSRALHRRWFERRLSHMPLDSVPGLVDLGSSYGGWTIPEGLIQPDWTCYSVGAGEDISFDLELIRRFGVVVRSVDPVPEYVHRALLQAGGDPRFSAHHAAIATGNGPVQMQRTHHPGSSSLSAAELYDTHSYLELPGRSLPSLMSELGDSRIDLLKLDIEGSEYEVLPTLDLRTLGVKVFATQVHHNGSVKEALRLVAQLREQRYEAVACRPVIKLTFLDRDLLERSR